MKDKKLNASDIVWEMFIKSGNPAHYELYKKLKG